MVTRFSGKLLMVCGMFVLAAPAFAGIAYHEDNSSATAPDAAALAGAPVGSGDALGVVLSGSGKGGLAVGSAVDGEAPVDPAAKSLYAFSTYGKTFDYDAKWYPQWPGHDDGGNCPGGVVPEPGSMLLLGMGLGALGIRRFRMKRES